jgi:uncharacterized protein (TIGR02996 family)
MSVLEGLLQSVVDEPGCEANWLVLADWLEENDDPRRAELLRLHRKLLATCCEPERHPQRREWQARIVELLGQRVRPCVPQQTVLLRKRPKVLMTFAWIPPGTFLMGSPTDEAKRIGFNHETRHRVTLTRGFYLATHPVTQAQWQAATRRNPSRFKGDDTRPAENVSWDDCQEFCRKLGLKTGWRFRLPTEAEWEYACRAGTTTPFFFGDTISTDQANYDGNAAYGRGKKGAFRQQTTPAGSFPPNAWGLYEMHGNVWEWCADLYAPHDQCEATDPTNITRGTNRVLRGGSWSMGPFACRSACRSWIADRCRDFIGCRVCLCLD